MQAELTPFRVDLLNLEAKARSEAKGFSCEGDGLADRGWAFGLKSFDPKRAIKPLGIAFPVDEVLPDHLNRGGDDGSGTDG
jgi:hypothetical protein